MGPTIAATAYSLVAVIAATLLRPRLAPNAAVPRAAIFWLLSVPVLFLIPYNMAGLLACGTLGALLAPKSRDDRLAFFFLMFPAVPDIVRADVPFPGINYLFTLDFFKVSVFFLLAASFLTARRPAAAKFTPAIGICVLLMTALFVLLQFRAENLTNGLRQGANIMLVYALPFLGLIRLMKDEENIDKVLTAFAFLAAIFFFSAVVSQLTRWNFYDHLSQRHGVAHFADFRNGVLRVSVTLNTVLAGYVLGVGLLAIEYFRSCRIIGRMAAWTFRLGFALALYFTYSRGAWFASAFGVMAFFFFTKFPRGSRPFLLGLGLLVAAPAAVVYALNADFSAVDEFGTFAYRQELLRATWVHVQQYPLFGDALFLERPHFQHLRQGEGIIDFVNYYVQIVVEYGIVGLLLFVAPFAIVVAGLLALPRRAPEIFGSADEQRRAVVLAMIASYLLLISTTSAVSYTAHFGVGVLAIGAAFLAAMRAKYAGVRGAARAEDALLRPDPAQA